MQSVFVCGETVKERGFETIWLRLYVCKLHCIIIRLGPLPAAIEATREKGTDMLFSSRRAISAPTQITITPNNMTDKESCPACARVHQSYFLLRFNTWNCIISHLTFLVTLSAESTGFFVFSEAIFSCLFSVSATLWFPLWRWGKRQLCMEHLDMFILVLLRQWKWQSFIVYR